MSKRDNNFRSIADVDGLVLAGETIDPRTVGIDPRTIDDVLKLSHARHVTLRGCAVRAGGRQRENAIDLNRGCQNVFIFDCRVEAGAQNALTIKGGCRDITVTDLVIERAGGNCDIELGNWSDQSHDLTRGVRLINVTRADGRPVRLRVGRAERPEIIGGNVRENKAESLILKTAWWAKYFYVRLLLRKTPPLLP